MKELETRKANHEPIYYEKSHMSLKIWQVIYKDKEKDLLHCKWHYHEEVEMILIVNGKMDVAIRNETYKLKQGDVLLIGSNQLHRSIKYKDSRELTYIVFQIDLQHFFDQTILKYMRPFSEILNPLDRLNYIFEDNPAVRQNVYQEVYEIYQESLSKAYGYEIAIGSYIRNILLSLLRNDNRKILERSDSDDYLFLKPVLDHIEHHLDDKINVNEMCKLVNLSYYYFTRLFKRIMGTRFTEYVNQKRIKKSETLLLTKDWSINQIANEVGIPNSAHYYELFRRYNDCSPKEFRKLMMGS